MDDKLVSVIMPVYNASLYLQEAIDSILNQSYKNIELIIINDGSNDGGKCEKIVHSYGARIQYYKKKNGGVASALNVGIEKAKGVFVARMDADDIAEPLRIEKQVDFLTEHQDIMLVGTQGVAIDKNGVKLRYSHMPLDNDDIKATLLFKNCIWHPTVMFRRLIFDDGLRYEQVAAEDYDLWTRIAADYQLANLPDRLLRYREHGANISQTHFRENAMSAAYSAKRYIENLFDLNLSAYDIDDVGYTKGEFERQQDWPTFIIRQIRLLRAIWEANAQKEHILENSLRRVLNERWFWCLRAGNAHDLSVFSRVARLNGISADVEKGAFFLQALADSYQCNIEAICEDTNLWNDLHRLDKDYQRFLSQKSNIVVYGLGNRGSRFLRMLLRKKGKGECNWELVAVSDKNVKGREVENIFYQSLAITEIQRVHADYVIVTPDAYRQIEQELLSNGIEANHIISADIFL